jgi:NAD(P)-dependent dehydrogenase (short-subunit alcohol dehydrogenase family)
MMQAGAQSQKPVPEWARDIIQREFRTVKHSGVKVGLAGADLSSEAGVNSGIDEVLKRFGEKVDVLINNVGAGSVRRFDEISDDEWKKNI